MLAGLFAKSLVGLLAGFIAGLLFGVSEYRPVEIIRWKWVQVRQNILLLLVVGLLTGLLAGLIVGALAGLLAGLLDGLLVLLLVVLLAGLREYQPLEIIRWKWVQVRQNVVSLLLIGLLIGPLVGLLAGLLIAPFVGLLVGLFAELFLGLSVGFSSDQLDPRELIIPNDSVQSARRNGFHFGLLTGLLAGLLVGLITWLFFDMLTGIFAGVLFGLLVGSLFGLLFGLGAFFHQQKLLAFLRCLGAIPKHYIQFLDYAAECILLHKIGGGYIFIHRLLLEYFAALDEPKPSEYTSSEGKTEKHTPAV